MTETIWCQWDDIDLPNGFNLLTDENDLTDQAKLDQITVYIPKYMGGA